tara:strand:- start:1257 stop:1457 length:201 start_codon:yes stop_codon:yes gene_type:complete
MAHEIKYPTQRTYVIAYTDTTIFTYITVNPDQVMDTGQPYLWTSLSEAEWLQELLDVYNTIPEQPY